MVKEEVREGSLREAMAAQSPLRTTHVAGSSTRPIKIKGEGALSGPLKTNGIKQEIVLI